MHTKPCIRFWEPRKDRMTIHIDVYDFCIIKYALTEFGLDDCMPSNLAKRAKEFKQELEEAEDKALGRK